MRIKGKDVKKAAVKAGEVTLFAGLWVVCAAVDLAVGTVKMIAETVADSGKYQRQRERDLSLTCRKCGRMAGPISGTSNRYRCGCGRQFSADKHHL
jgi:hypothetical protein